MRRRTMRVVAAAIVIGAAFWSYGISIAKSAEWLDQTRPGEPQQTLCGISDH